MRQSSVAPMASNSLHFIRNFGKPDTRYVKGWYSHMPCALIFVHGLMLTDFYCFIASILIMIADFIIQFYHKHQRDIVA